MMVGLVNKNRRRRLIPEMFKILSSDGVDRFVPFFASAWVVMSVRNHLGKLLGLRAANLMVVEVSHRCWDIRGTQLLQKELSGPVDS